MLEEKKFHSLNALGLALTFLGNGVFFYLRSFFVPSSLFQASTLVFLILSLFIAQSKTPYHLVYRFNSTIALAFYSFFFIIQCYFVLYTPKPENTFREFANALIPIIFLISILRLSDEIKEHFFEWVVWISLFSTLILIYSFFTKPELVLGTRASINYSDQGGANPQLYSKISYIGLIAAFSALQFKELSSSKRFIYNLTFLISGLGILFTQVRTTILVLFIIVPLMLLISDLRGSLVKVFQWKTLAFLSICYLIFRYLFNFDLLELVEIYFNQFSKFTGRALQTVLTLGQTEDVDSSANSRIELLKTVFDHLETNPHTLLLGNGYRYLYVDVPVAEILISYGLGGLLHFLAYSSITAYFALKGIFSKDYFQVFLGFLFIYLTITQFTQGAPMDVYYLFSMALFVRFLGVKNHSPK